jgi:hypothetical protein
MPIARRFGNTIGIHSLTPILKVMMYCTVTRHCQKVSEYLSLLKWLDCRATNAAVMVIRNPIHGYLGCKEQDIEACAVKLELTALNIYVVTVYRAPCGNLTHFLMD